MTEDEHREIEQVLTELEAEEAEQEAARGYASQHLARAIARLRQLAAPTGQSTVPR